MNWNSILSVFTPKDVKFFPLLNETAETLNKSAVLLVQLFSIDTAKEQRLNICRLIKEEEVKGDQVTNKIFKALNQTFITPFDREDISALADSMDDAIDSINRAAHKVQLYEPDVMTAATLQLAEIVQKATNEVLVAVSELSSVKSKDQSIRAHAKEVKHYEEAADTVYEKGITDLFHSNLPTIELIKLKEIIQELEKASNKINNIGKVLKTIIVKYA